MEPNDSKEQLNQTKSENLITKIKYNYYFKILFSLIEKMKFLEIIRYNKEIQKLYNVNLNDYKEYKEFSEKKSSIKIEIIPTKKKSGKFININEKDELFHHYHIFFNDNKEKKFRTYLNADDNVINQKN